MSTISAERFRPTDSVSTLAAWSLIAGAVLQIVLGFPLAHLQASVPVPTGVLVLNAVSHVLLLFGLAALARSGVLGQGGWIRAGLGLAIAGFVALTLAEFTAMVSMDAAGVLYFGSSLAIALGMILAGVAVLRAGRWGGWHRFMPLVCGLFIPLALFPAFALPGYAPHYAIALWGLCWGLLGVATLAEGAPG